MACRLLFVSVGLLSTGSASFAPITWANAPGKELTLLPQSFTGPLSQWSNDIPQKLAVGEAIDSRMALFSAKPDNTISVEDWCVEAVGAKSGDAVNVNVCNGGATQQWNWIPEGHGRNKIQLKDTSLCLDVDSKAGRSSGAAVQLRQCEDTSSESWMYEAPKFGSDVQHVMMALMSLAGVGALSLGAWLWQRHSKAPVVLGGMPGNGVSMTAPTAFSRTGDARMSMGDATDDDMVEGGLNMADGNVNRRDFALNAAAVATGLVGIATNAQPASAKAGQFGNLSFFGTGLSSPFEEGGNKVGKDVTYGFKKSSGPMLADAYASDLTREKARFMEAEKILRAQGPNIESKTWWLVQANIRNKDVGDMKANMFALNAASKDPKASAKAKDKFWKKIDALELACVNKKPEDAKKAYAKALEALDAYKAIAL